MNTSMNNKIRKSAVTGILGLLAAVSLAACGGAVPTATAIPATATLPATATVEMIPTQEPTSAPEATATEIEATSTPVPADTAVPTNTEVLKVATNTPEIVPTETPVEVPTEAPTEEPTQVPTEPPTIASIEAPTEASLDEILEPTATTQSAASSTIDATLREWAIDLSQAEVSAGTVTLNVSNTGQFSHNLAVLNSAGETVGTTPTFSSSAGVQTLVVELEPGTYTLICSLPGHASRGQKITLTVK